MRTHTVCAGVSFGRDVPLKHNILVVDDAKMNVKILDRMLSELGHNIMPAYSGEEALALADEYDFSVVLLDVKMPGMDGYEVARRLREKTAPNYLPILFVTASADQEVEVTDGYTSGGVDYLIKPVEPAIVRRKVEIFCQLQEKEKQIGAQLTRIEAQKAQLETQLDEMRLLESARVESEIRYRSLVSLSPQPIIVQVAGELVFYNTSSMDIFGLFEDSAMVGRAFHSFVVEEDSRRVKAWIEEIERRGGRSEPIECTLKSHDPTEEKRQVELHACCILYDDKEGVQMAIQDVTEHKLIAEKLRTLSQVDGLTGVWNRRSFDEQIDKEIRRHIRNDKPLALIMIDLDQFKKFNDNYGHHEGDGCLKGTANAMTKVCTRPADMVSRYGGEEFVILLPETGAEGAKHIASKLVAEVYALGIRHEHNRGHGVVTISCGVTSQNPGRDATPAQFVEAADGALYFTKQNGGNGVHLDTEANASADS